MGNSIRRNVSRALVVMALGSAAVLVASEGRAAPLASQSCNDKDNLPAFCKAVPGDRAEGWMAQGRSPPATLPARALLRAVDRARTRQGAKKAMKLPEPLI